MLTPGYLRVWQTAKILRRRLNHPAVSAAHVLYPFLSYDEKRVHRLWRECPVSAADVRKYLISHPELAAPVEETRAFPLASSAKRIIEQTENVGGLIGEKRLFAAIRSETTGLVEAIAAGAAADNHG